MMPMQAGMPPGHGGLVFGYRGVWCRATQAKVRQSAHLSIVTAAVIAALLFITLSLLIAVILQQGATHSACHRQAGRLQ